MIYFIQFLSVEGFCLKFSQEKQYVKTHAKYWLYVWNSNGTISFEDLLWPVYNYTQIRCSTIWKLQQDLRTVFLVWIYLCRRHVTLPKLFLEDNLFFIITVNSFNVILMIFTLDRDRRKSISKNFNSRAIWLVVRRSLAFHVICDFLASIAFIRLARNCCEQNTIAHITKQCTWINALSINAHFQNWPNNVLRVFEVTTELDSLHLRWLKIILST